MKPIATAAIATLVAFAAPAAADDTAPFTGIFASDPKACKDTTEAEPSDALRIDRDGIWGYESGCSFLGFHRQNIEGSDEPFAWLAVASCADDSGVLRGDLITLIPQDDGNSLRVQSQNEYILGLAQQGSGSDGGMSFDYITGTYERCR